MKLLKHSAERRGNDSMKVSAQWRDHFRRPAQVTITYGQQQHAEDATLIEGDVKQCTDVLFSIAEMAWGMGWRPRGFPGYLANLALQYKIPAEEVA